MGIHIACKSNTLQFKQTQCKNQTTVDKKVFIYNKTKSITNSLINRYEESFAKRLLSLM